MLGWGNLITASAAAFGAEGSHIFELNGRLFVVDFDKSAYVSRIS
jgi:hypothetical protein